MKIIETQHRNRFGQLFTLVMSEGAVNDVACYEIKGHVDGEVAARDGSKLSERDALLVGFTIPEGKHYRR